jgi:predicted N-acyltransferase
LETALRREFGRRLQAVAYRQVYAGEMPVFQRGTTLTREGKSVAVLANRFADYDDYLRTLSRSRRQDQRRLARVIDAEPSLTVRFQPTADSGIDLDAFCALSDDVARRNHRDRWPPLRTWSPRLFRTVLTLPDVHVLSYTEDGGRLVAASALFDHPVAPVLGPWGAPPLGEGRRSGLWFDHMGREIRWSIERGREVVLGGKGADEAKRALGFVSYPQWTVLRRLGR